MFINIYKCKKCKAYVEYPVMSSHYMVCMEEDDSNKSEFEYLRGRCCGKLDYLDAKEITKEEGVKIFGDWVKEIDE